MNARLGVVIALICTSLNAFAQPIARTPIYGGVGAPNNGVASNSENHLNAPTIPLGCTIDAGSAIPADAYVPVYAGTATSNYRVLSNFNMHLSGATEHIGMLSKRPIVGGTQIYAGIGAKNNKVLSQYSGHMNDTTEPYGWTMPCPRS